MKQICIRLSLDDGSAAAWSLNDRVEPAVVGPAFAGTGAPPNVEYAPEPASFRGAGRVRPLRDRIRARLIEEAVATGADPVQAAHVVDELAGERPLLEWLQNGGFEKLLALLLELLKIGA